MRVWIPDEDYAEAWRALNPFDDTASRSDEFRVLPTTHNGDWLGRAQMTGPWQPGLWIKVGAEQAANPLNRALGLVSPAADEEMLVDVILDEAGVPVVTVNGDPELWVAIRRRPVPGPGAFSVACVGSPVYQGLSHPEELRALSLLFDVKVKSFTNLRSSGGLRTLSLSYCLSLKSLKGLADLAELETLVIDNCDGLKSVCEISKAPTLRELVLMLPAKVDTIPDLSRLGRLEVLDLSGSRNLDSLEPIRNAQALRALSIRSSRSAVDVSPLSDLPMLEHLDLTGTSIAYPSSMSGLKNLAGIAVSRRSVNELSRFPSLERVRYLRCTEMSGLKSPGALGEMQEVEQLDLLYSSALRTLDGIQRMSKLKTLDVSRCPHLEDLSAVEGHPSLESINIWGCGELRRLEPLLASPAMREITVGGDLGEWLVGDFKTRTMTPDELRAILAGAIPRPPKEPRHPSRAVSEDEGRLWEGSMMFRDLVVESARAELEPEPEESETAKEIKQPEIFDELPRPVAELVGPGGPVSTAADEQTIVENHQELLARLDDKYKWIADDTGRLQSLTISKSGKRLNFQKIFGLGDFEPGCMDIDSLDEILEGVAEKIDMSEGLQLVPIIQKAWNLAYAVLRSDCDSTQLYFLPEMAIPPDPEAVLADIIATAFDVDAPQLVLVHPDLELRPPGRNFSRPFVYHNPFHGLLAYESKEYDGKLDESLAAYVGRYFHGQSMSDPLIIEEFAIDGTFLTTGRSSSYPVGLPGQVYFNPWHGQTWQVQSLCHVGFQTGEHWTGVESRPVFWQVFQQKRRLVETGELTGSNICIEYVSGTSARVQRLLGCDSFVRDHILGRSDDVVSVRFARRIERDRAAEEAIVDGSDVTAACVLDGQTVFSDGDGEIYGESWNTIANRKWPPFPNGQSLPGFHVRQLSIDADAGTVFALATCLGDAIMGVFDLRSGELLGIENFRDLLEPRLENAEGDPLRALSSRDWREFSGASVLWQVCGSGFVFVKWHEMAADARWWSFDTRLESITEGAIPARAQVEDIAMTGDEIVFFVRAIFDPQDPPSDELTVQRVPLKSAFPEGGGR